MKPRWGNPSLALGALPAALLFAAGNAGAQALPKLEATPAVLGADKTITLTLSPEFANRESSLRVGLYEHDRPTKLSEIKKKFTVQNGRLSATVQLEGDPGRYDFRVLADDKARSALTEQATVLVPGMMREPGWWLPNGSPFLEISKEPASPADANAPLFVPGLRRDGKKFDRKVWGSSAPLTWSVLATNPIPLTGSGLDETAFKRQLQDLVAQARQSGRRNLLGVQVPVSTSVIKATLGQTDIAKKVRSIVAEVAGDAALILQIPVEQPDLLDKWLTAWAPHCDALAIEIGSKQTQEGSWAEKIARRIVEEQPQYDLPIWITWDRDIEWTNNIFPSRSPSTMPRTAKLIVHKWMSGATNLALPQNHHLVEPQRMIERNASLFYGSVTLEDAGLLTLDAQPPPQERTTTRSLYLYYQLQGAGRLPSLARLQQKNGTKIPESFMASLDYPLSGEMIEKLKIAARDGATIYLEGTPKVEAHNQQAAQELLGAGIKSIPPQTTHMTLNDAWLFGSARGLKIPVYQDMQAGPLNGPRTLPKKEAEAKGKDILLEPRVLATLEDGTPALIENPIGDGVVIWFPHHVGNLSGQRIIPPWDYYAAIPKYYAAIAARVSSTALVQVEGDYPVWATVRRSPKGTWVVGLFDWGFGDQQKIRVSINHYADAVLDLTTEKELPFTTRGNRTTIETTIPQEGWQIIALGESRRELDQERFAARAKVRLK